MHLVGVTELHRMLGNDPTLAHSVLYGLGRWVAGRSGGGGGHGPAAQGLGEGGGGGRGDQQQQQQRGEDTPRQKPQTQTPPKGPRKEATPLRE